jgi:hypothetical protein
MVNVIKFLVLAACLGLPVVQCWASDNGIRVPKIEEVRRIEALIVMPKGAHPIRDYTRFYGADVYDGHREIYGQFELGGDKKIHLVDHVDNVFDGGCAIVSFAYNLDARGFRFIECNGVA